MEKFDDSAKGKLLVVARRPNGSAGPLCEVRYRSKKRYYVKVLDPHGIRDTSLRGDKNPYVPEREVLALDVTPEQYEELKIISAPVEKRVDKLLAELRKRQWDLQREYDEPIKAEQEALRHRFAELLG